MPPPPVSHRNNLKHFTTPLVALLVASVFCSGARADNTTSTVTGNTYANLYGNTGDVTTPTDATSNGNKLTLGDSGSGPTITDSSTSYVSGGQTATGTTNGTANNNQLIINAGTDFSGSNLKRIHGGYVIAGSGTASNNTVTINQFTQGTGSVEVWGGLAATGNVSSNMVTIASAGTINSVSGGYATGAGNAGGSAGTGNIVNITGGSATITGVIGGQSNGGFASYNEVNIESGYTGIINGVVSGGYVPTGTGTTEYNKVTIAGGTLNGVVRGGYSSNGAATHNEVTISGGTVGGNITGGLTTSGSATNNTVTISITGKTYQDIYGGRTAGSAGDLFTGNTLNLTAGNTSIASVQNMETINFTSAGDAAITTLDTTVRGATGTPLVKLNTDTNNVTFGATSVISGSGGIEKTGAGTLTLSGANDYTGLTEVKNGTLDVSGGSIANSSGLELYGGSTFIANTGYTLNNKTLTVRGENANYQGDLSAQNATLNFIAPVNISQPMLNVTGDADVSNSFVNVGVSGGTSLPTGTELQLLNVTGTLTGAETLTEGSGIVESGVTTIYGLTLAFDPATNSLVGKVTKAALNPQTKSFSEARLSQLAFVNQGSDLIAGQGLFAALDATANRTERTTTTFGALSGGSSRYKTGSHSDVTGLSLITGLAGNSRLAHGKITLGAFFEYGNANYDSYNSFVNAASVHGKGGIDYTGGGVLAHFEFNPTARGNAWLESSARFGETSVDFKTGDMFDQSSGQHPAFASENNYAAAHIGLGYHWNLTKRNGFDIYAQYLWSRQNADTAELTTGETIKFEVANSERLRLGSRFVYNLNPHRRAFAGIAWEHEFDGEANASIYGFRLLDTPKLTGDTCKLELGLTLQPTKTCPVTRNFGIQGYTGKREGVAGSVEVRYEF